MKKFCLFLIVIILALFSFSACNYNSGEITELKEDMTAEELFDYLKKQDSFSIQVDNFDYRFIKNKGYSIWEDEDGYKKFESYIIEDGKVYSVISDKENGLVVRYKGIEDSDYEKILEMYYRYVAYARGSYGVVTRDGEVLNIEIKNNEAVVKTIYTPEIGYLEIKECRIFDINSTELYIPKAYANYKELAIEYEESMS